MRIIRIAITSVIMLCIFSDLSAQLIIAKDPRECLYGLKDSAGKWVLQPQYNDVRYEGWYYRLNAGEKYGAAALDGKVILPVQYDYIDGAWCEFPEYGTWSFPHSEHHLYGRVMRHFIIRVDNKTGLAGPRGNIIIAPQLLALSRFYGGIAIGVTADSKSVLVDTTGILATLPTEYRINPDDRSYVARNRFVVSTIKKVNDYYSIYNYGVCDERGNFILQPVYRSVHSGLARLNIILADTASGECATFTLDGERLGPFEYHVQQTPQSQYQWQNDFVYVSINYRIGVLGRNGKLIVPCQYDSLRFVRKSMTETIFYCHNGTKHDVYSDTRPILVNHNYHNVKLAFEHFLTKAMLILVEQDEKWGAFDESMSVVMPIEFDTTFESRNNIVFYSRDEVRIIYTHADDGYTLVPRVSEPDSLIQRNCLYSYNSYRDTAGQPFKNVISDWHGTQEIVDTILYWRRLSTEHCFLESHLQSIWTEDSIRIFWDVSWPNMSSNDEYWQNGGDVAIARAVSKSDGQLKLSEVWKQTTPKGDRLFYVVIDQVRLYDKTGKYFIKPKPKVNQILTYPPGYDSVMFVSQHTYKGKWGISDANGNIILDTNYFSITPFTENLLWVGSVNRNDNLCYTYYSLYSISDAKFIVDTSFKVINIPIEYCDSLLPINTMTGIGLYNFNSKKFVIPPYYQYIFPLDDQRKCFALTDQNGNSFLADVNGHKQKQVTISRICVINKTSPYHLDSNSIDSTLTYAITSGASTIIMNNFRSSNYENVNRDSLFESLVHVTTIYDYDKSNFGVPRIQSDSATMFFSWEKKLLCDSVIFSHIKCDYRYLNVWHDYEPIPRCFQYQELYCENNPVKNYVDFEGGWDRPTYYCAFVDSSALSIIAFNGESFGTRKYENYLLIDSVPVRQTLSSLFMNDAWKQLIINKLLVRLDSHPEIIANCTDISSYPKLLEERFLIGDSLYLYPDWEVHGYWRQPVTEVAVPWSDLSPFMKSEVKAALEIE